MEKMKEVFESIITSFTVKPKEVKINLPQLAKL
jgi:hypothetical protein